MGSEMCIRDRTYSFSTSHMKRSEVEAASMLTRFGIGRSSTNPDCIHVHEIIKLYAWKRGATRVAQAMYSASHEHLWAACFLLFGFGNDLVVVEPKPSETGSAPRHAHLHYLLSLQCSIGTSETLPRCIGADCRICGLNRNYIFCTLRIFVLRL